MAITDVKNLIRIVRQEWKRNKNTALRVGQAMDSIVDFFHTEKVSVTAQDLTDAQKQQARTNIGAISTEHVLQIESGYLGNARHDTEPEPLSIPAYDGYYKVISDGVCEYAEGSPTVAVGDLLALSTTPVPPASFDFVYTHIPDTSTVKTVEQTFNDALKQQARKNIGSQSEILLNVKDFGAKGDGATDDTIAIQNAYNAAKVNLKQLYIPSGIYVHTGLIFDASVNVTGDGYRSILKNVHATNDGITILPVTGQVFSLGVCELSNINLRGTSTGACIVFDTQGSFVLRNINIENAAGIGIYVGKTIHVSCLSIINCNIQDTVGSAIYGRHLSSKQINAVRILNSHIILNNGKGIDLFGNVINIQNCIIEGNRDVGINISSSDNISTNEVIRTYNITGCYMENNANANINVDLGIWATKYKLLEGLNISNNYLYNNSTNYNLKFSRRGDNSAINTFTGNCIRDMIFQNNKLGHNNTVYEVVDFDNTLNSSCYIYPTKPIYSSNYRYINLGLAKFIGRKKRVIYGYTDAYSTDSISYASPLDNKTTAIWADTAYKYVHFPIKLDINEIIDRVSVPLYFNDTTKIADIIMILKYSSIENGTLTPKLYREVLNITHDSTVNAKIIDSITAIENTNDLDLFRAGTGREEWFLTIGIRKNSASEAAEFYLGNPIITIN